MEIAEIAASSFLTPEHMLPDYEASAADAELLTMLMAAIRAGEADFESIAGAFGLSSFPADCRRIALVLYAPGHKRILVSREAQSGAGDVFTRVLKALLRHPRCRALGAADFRLQIDFVVEPPLAVDFSVLGVSQVGERHFEPGIDGLLFKTAEAQTHLFLPGDAFVRSIMGMQQLREYLFRAYGETEIRG